MSEIINWLKFTYPLNSLWGTLLYRRTATTAEDTAPIAKARLGTILSSIYFNTTLYFSTFFTQAWYLSCIKSSLYVWVILLLL